MGHWTVDSINSPSYADRHGSPFRPEQESRLSQIASHDGTETERLRVFSWAI
jgi:hypothetical protein